MSTRLMWLLFHTGSKIRLANRSPSTSSTVCLATKWSMRNTSRSSNDRAISAFSAFASSRSVPNGFSTTRVVWAGRSAPASASSVGRNSTFGSARYTAIGAAAPLSAARRASADVTSACRYDTCSSRVSDAFSSRSGRCASSFCRACAR